MSKLAVVRGTFSDFKIIKTRSVCVLSIEVPIEHADAALEALGGVPQPATERPVAIARLVEEPKAASPVKSLQAKERYANADEMTKAVTRAALLCKDRGFWDHMGADSEDDARSRLCVYLQVKSRSAIGESPDIYRAFLNLEAEYRTQQQVAGYSEHLTGIRQ